MGIAGANGTNGVFWVYSLQCLATTRCLFLLFPLFFSRPPQPDSSFLSRRQFTIHVSVFIFYTTDLGYLASNGQLQPTTAMESRPDRRLPELRREGSGKICCLLIWNDRWLK